MLYSPEESTVPITVPGFVPRRSNHYAFWLPLYLEPIIGSGERLCIGIVAADHEGLHLKAVPTLERLRFIYGDEVAAIALAARLAIDAARKKLLKDGLRGLRDWSPPMEGVTVGEIRQGAGVDIDDLMDIAMTQCSSIFATAR